MCRPIESRDSLAAVCPATAALFAGYQPSGTKSNNAKQQRNGGMMSLPPWSPSAQVNGVPAGFAMPDAMNMMAMGGAPPLPFVSFPKNLPSMPWINASANMNDFGSFPLTDEQFVDSEEKPSMAAAMAKTADDLETAELEELLDFSMPDDLESIMKDKEDLNNMDDGFDGTEMSILYSFLVDTPEEKSENKEAMNLTADDGILNLNMLSGSAIDVLDEGFTDEELILSPPNGREMDLLVKDKPMGEVKSRRLCKSEGCYKRSRSNGLCISHGGGRRCAIDGCDKSSQGGNLCIRHGGGKRCSHDGCDKAAQSNFLCKAHGGGPRCQVDGCQRSSQGGGYCRSHGGGKRCMFDGCEKGTQRGDYCALHGGSRLCEVPGCMRNDRGGGLCATHGGGKRCVAGNCNKPCRRKGLCSAHLRQLEGK